MSWVILLKNLKPRCDQIYVVIKKTSRWMVGTNLERVYLHLTFGTYPYIALCKFPLTCAVHSVVLSNFIKQYQQILLSSVKVELESELVDLRNYPNT